MINRLNHLSRFLLFAKSVFSHISQHKVMDILIPSIATILAGVIGAIITVNMSKIPIQDPTIKRKEAEAEILKKVSEIIAEPNRNSPEAHKLKKEFMALFYNTQSSIYCLKSGERYNAFLELKMDIDSYIPDEGREIMDVPLNNIKLKTNKLSEIFDKDELKHDEADKCQNL
jgi:hypothetical protein